LPPRERGWPHTPFTARTWVATYTIHRANVAPFHTSQRLGAIPLHQCRLFGYNGVIVEPAGWGRACDDHHHRSDLREWRPQADPAFAAQGTRSGPDHDRAG